MLDGDEEDKSNLLLDRIIPLLKEECQTDLSSLQVDKIGRALLSALRPAFSDVINNAWKTQEVKFSINREYKAFLIWFHAAELLQLGANEEAKELLQKLVNDVSVRYSSQPVRVKVGYELFRLVANIDHEVENVVSKVNFHSQVHEIVCKICAEFFEDPNEGFVHYCNLVLSRITSLGFELERTETAMSDFLKEHPTFISDYFDVASKVFEKTTDAISEQWEVVAVHAFLKANAIAYETLRQDITTFIMPEKLRRQFSQPHLIYLFNDYLTGFGLREFPTHSYIFYRIFEEIGDHEHARQAFDSISDPTLKALAERDRAG